MGQALPNSDSSDDTVDPINKQHHHTRVESNTSNSTTINKVEQPMPFLLGGFNFLVEVDNSQQYPKQHESKNQTEIILYDNEEDEAYGYKEEIDNLSRQVSDENDLQIVEEKTEILDDVIVSDKKTSISFSLLEKKTSSMSQLDYSDPTISWDPSLISPLESEWVETAQTKINRLPQGNPYKQLSPQTLVCYDRFMSFFLGNLKFTKSSILDRKAKGPYLKVKLLISDTGGESMVCSLFKKGANNLIKLVVRDRESSLGIVHTGLIIGPYQLDFYNDSFVHVKKHFCSSSRAIIVLDVGRIEGEENIAKALRAITVQSCLYNGFYKYSGVKRNCQHFVFDLLDRMKDVISNYNTSEHFDFFLKSIRESKEYRMTYKYSEDLKSLIEKAQKDSKFVDTAYRQTHVPIERISSFIKCEKYNFTRRDEMLQFVKFIQYLSNHLTKSDYFTKGRSGEFILFKAFDRAFSLKHMALTKEMSKIIPNTQAKKKLLSILQNKFKRVDLWRDGSDDVSFESLFDGSLSIEFNSIINLDFNMGSVVIPSTMNNRLCLDKSFHNVTQ